MLEIAKEVENLLTLYPKTVEQFRKQIAAFNQHWRKYWQSLTDEPLPYEDVNGKNKKPGYEYDSDFKMWFPINTGQVIPDPTKWEINDKLSCYYTTLAIIYDLIKGKDAPFKLCNGVLDNLACRHMEWLITKGYGGFDRDRLDTAIKWVKKDLETQSFSKFVNTTTKLHKCERLILKELNNCKERIFQVDLEATTNISRNTVSKYLKKLLKAKCISYPDGKRGGIAITTLGQKMLSTEQ